MGTPAWISLLPCGSVEVILPWQNPRWISSHFTRGTKQATWNFTGVISFQGRIFLRSLWQAGSQTRKQQNPKTEMNLLEYFPNSFGSKHLGPETPNFKNLLILAGGCANFQGVVAGIIKLIEAVSTYTLNSCFYIPTSLKQPLQHPQQHCGRQQERNHMEKTGNEKGSPQFKEGEHTRIQPGNSGRRLTASKDEGLKRSLSSHIIWVCISLKYSQSKTQ